jgi:hypothetical protein
MKECRHTENSKIAAAIHGGSCPNCLRKQVKQLIEENERLTKDAERLDWLHDQSSVVVLGAPGNNLADCFFDGKNIRDAIDRAIKRAKQQRG